MTSTLISTGAVTDDEVARLRAKHYNASVVGVRDVNAGLRILRVRPDWGRLDFQAGQYTVLGLGDWEPSIGEPDARSLGEGELIRRAYSVSSSLLDDTGKLLPPSASPYLEFDVTLAPAGDPHRPQLTPRLFHLRAGDRLHVGPHAHGRYTLAGVAPDEQIVFVATGTGEAPHNAMLAELLASGSRQPIVSVTCVRYWIDLGYLEAHRELQRRFANYRYLTLTTREPENLDRYAVGYVGKRHLQDYFVSGEFERAAELRLDPSRTQVYLCGNPEMVGLPGAGDGNLPPEGMVSILERRGFVLDSPDRPGNLHCERYW
jgi:ferredoxin--NADP+ reductase